MDRENILRRIEFIIGEVLNEKSLKINEETTAGDVDGWDSLSHMTILAGIEKDFNIRFKLREINKLTNINSLISLIQSKL